MAKIEPQDNGGSPLPVESLIARSLSCQRGGRVVVPGLTFEVKAGSVLVLRGPNGSGKTTLLRTVAGYIPAASGHIAIRRVKQSPPSPGGEGFSGVASIPGKEDGTKGDLFPEDSAFHYIGHANGIKPRLTVIENVSFWQQYYGGAPGIERAEAALEAFDLLDLASFSAGHLSQGQARRLGLARLLAASRPIWLLDEPSVSLDTASTRLLERAIADHLGAGGLALISTHLELALPNASVLALGAPAALQ